MATEGDANPPAESFRLRVANLAWGTTDEAFTEFFAKHNATEAVIIRRKRTGRSRGYGFVTFDSQETMDGALSALDGQNLDDREIKMEVSTSKGPYPEGSKKPEAEGAGDDTPAEPESARRLIVQRLAWSIEDEQLQEAFGKFGEVESAKVIRNRRNGRSRGYGFVTFKEEADGQKALDEMNGSEALGFKPEDGDAEGIRVLMARSQGARPAAPARKPRERRPRRRRDDADGDDGDDRPKIGPRRIFVRDLSEDTTEETLNETFSAYGEIKNVRLIKDRETEKSRGLAYVTFELHDDFKKAMDAYAEEGEGPQIDEQTVSVSRAFPSRFNGRGRGRGRGRRRQRRGGRGGDGDGGGGTKGGDGPTDL